MKKSKLMSFFLIAIYIATSSICYAQPNISKERIPSDIPDDLRSLILRLYSPTANERARAAWLLGEDWGRRYPDVITPFLIGMLGDTAPAGKVNDSWGRKVDYFVCTRAGRALVDIGEPAVDPLIEALNSKNPSIRTMAASILGQMKNAHVTEHLITMLKDENWGVRVAAVKALGKIGASSAIEPLISVTKDSNFEVRASAIFSLNHITCQNFGSNPDQYKQWQDWWEKNKEKFVKKTD